MKLFPLLLAAAGAAANLACPAGEAGPLVIIGGAWEAENQPVLRAILDGRIPGRPLCIIPLASENPQAVVPGLLADFNAAAGAGGAVGLDFPSSRPERARDPGMVRSLEGCGGFYFTGGDQSRIVDTLRPAGGSTPALEAILAVHSRGGVIAGSSAGAAMMSDPMIGGGDPEAALEYGVAAEEKSRGVWVRPGMGFFRHGLTDQHFLARGRLGRLLAVLAGRADIPLGLGVDENTAAVVRGDALEVLGEAWVVLVDLRQARRLAGGGLENGRMFLLGAGDRFDLSSGQARPAAGKTAVPQTARKLRKPARPWVEDRWASFLDRFLRFGPASLTIPAGKFQFSLHRGDRFAVVSREGRGRYGIPKDACAGPLEFDLTPRE